MADKVHLKRSYRAEFKLTRSELFVERSKKTPSLKSVSLSRRRFAAYAYFSRSFDKVTLTITLEIVPVPAGFTAVRWSQGSTPRKYAAHDTYSSIFLVHTLRQTAVTKEGRSKWRLWPLRPAVSCTRDGADWPKGCNRWAPTANQWFFGFIQMRDTLSTNGEHLRVAEVKLSSDTKINEIRQRRPKWRQFKRVVSLAGLHYTYWRVCTPTPPWTRERHSESELLQTVGLGLRDFRLRLFSAFRGWVGLRPRVGWIWCNSCRFVRELPRGWN